MDFKLLCYALLICHTCYANSLLQPAQRYRSISGLINAPPSEKSAQATFSISGSVISNITTKGTWISGNVTVSVVEGGVGFDHVTLNYDLTTEANGFFLTSVYTSEDDSEEFETYTTEVFKDLDRRFGESAPVKHDAVLEIQVTHINSNTSNVEEISIHYDDVIENCVGMSKWENGNGSREIDGGVTKNYLQLRLDIPENVDSWNSYTCYYVPKESRTLDCSYQIQKSRMAAGYGFYQIYDTVQDLPDESLQTREHLFDFIVLNYESEVDWINGTGVMNVTDGGVGVDFIGYTISADPHSFGTVEYNITYGPYETNVTDQLRDILGPGVSFVRED